MQRFLTESSEKKNKNKQKTKRSEKEFKVVSSTACLLQHYKTL